MVNGQITPKGKRAGYGKADAAIRPIALPSGRRHCCVAGRLLRRHPRRRRPPPSRRHCHYPADMQRRLRHLRHLDDYADLTFLQDGHTAPLPSNGGD